MMELVYRHELALVCVTVGQVLAGSGQHGAGLARNRVPQIESLR